MSLLAGTGDYDPGFRVGYVWAVRPGHNNRLGRVYLLAGREADSGMEGGRSPGRAWDCQARLAAARPAQR